MTLSSNAPRGPISYTYDTRYNGRLMSRSEAGGTRTWTYNDTGFVKQTADENGNSTWFVSDERGNVTGQTACSDPAHSPLTTPPGASCHTSYAGYFYNAANKLDPRNDVQIWTADGRSADANDTTYRTSRDIDAAGRPTLINYPKPAGQTANPTESFTYTQPGSGVPAGLLATHTARNGGVTANVYHPAGDLLTVTDPVGLATTNTYDQLGRIKTTRQSATVDGQPVDYGLTTNTYNGQIAAAHDCIARRAEPNHRGHAHQGHDVHVRQCRPANQRGRRRRNRRRRHPYDYVWVRLAGRR